eukprot:3393642-Pleurochrysis_carterae.AAC.1
MVRVCACSCVPLAGGRELELEGCRVEGAATTRSGHGQAAPVFRPRARPSRPRPSASRTALSPRPLRLLEGGVCT